jgi:hypothetical protein
MTYDTPYANEDLQRVRDEFDSGRVEVDDSEPPSVVLDEAESGGRSAVMSVRLPVRVIAQLKRAAEELDIGATVLARQLIVAGLADIDRNRPHTVHLWLTVSGGQVLDVHIDDPVAAIGDNPVEIEVEPIYGTRSIRGEEVPHADGS